MAAAPNNPTGVSPGLVPWENPNRSESTNAPHQNPIPRVSVNCKYPRKADSSKTPTTRNRTPQPNAYFQTAAPCNCNPSNARNPDLHSTSTRPESATNPQNRPDRKR